MCTGSILNKKLEIILQEILKPINFIFIFIYLSGLPVLLPFVYLSVLNGFDIFNKKWHNLNTCFKLGYWNMCKPMKIKMYNRERSHG